MTGIDFDGTVNRACVAVFGVASTGGGKSNYQVRDGGPSFDVDGIFDEAWADVDVTGGRHGLPISTTKPRFGLRLAEFPPGTSPRKRDTLALADGRQYTVEDTSPDGFGYVYLSLTEK